MTSTGLEITRYDDFPWGRTVLRLQKSYELDSYLQFVGLVDVTSPAHEQFVRITEDTAAHASITYLLKGPFALDENPKPERRILGALLRAAKSDAVTTVRAEAGTTLTVVFELDHLVFYAEGPASRREVGRAQLSGVSVLKLETLRPAAVTAAPTLVETHSSVPAKAIPRDELPVLALPDLSHRRLAWLRDRKNALLEVLARLCGPGDRRAGRTRGGYSSP